MRILTLANAYGPRTGGIRTQIDHLRAAYRAAGHEAVLVAPGESDAHEEDAAGAVYRLAAPEFPLNRDYRNLWQLRRVAALVEQIAPDSIEIVDKWTLPALARRLRRRGWPVLGFSCERLDQVLTPYLGHSPAVRLAVRRYNAWFGRQFDTVVCHSRYAAAELEAVGGQPLVVPLGVDLARCHPDRHDEALRRELLGDGRSLLLYVGRLVREKRVELLGEAMRDLAPRGWRLVVVGAGPLAGELARAPGTTSLGFIRDRERLAALYASCDVFVHPSPIETFGLGVLEALASGCRVVAASGGAAAEVLPRGWPQVAPVAAAWVAAVAAAGRLDPRVARRQAERFPWAATAHHLLQWHQGRWPGG